MKKGKMTLDAHRLEAEKKRIEESEARAREMIYAKEQGLPWPPEYHEKEWEADRQRVIDECKRRLDKGLKRMPEKQALKTPPRIDREAARDKARKIVADTDGFDEYEKRQDDINPQETVE